jgi:hypothetical protein
MMECRYVAWTLLSGTHGLLIGLGAICLPNDRFHATGHAGA